MRRVLQVFDRPLPFLPPPPPFRSARDFAREVSGFCQRGFLVSRLALRCLCVSCAGSAAHFRSLPTNGETHSVCVFCNVKSTGGSTSCGAASASRLQRVLLLQQRGLDCCALLVDEGALERGRARMPRPRSSASSTSADVVPAIVPALALSGAKLSQESGQPAGLCCEQPRLTLHRPSENPEASRCCAHGPHRQLHRPHLLLLLLQQRRPRRLQRGCRHRAKPVEEPPDPAADVEIQGELGALHALPRLLQLRLHPHRALLPRRGHRRAPGLPEERPAHRGGLRDRRPLPMRHDRELVHGDPRRRLRDGPRPPRDHPPLRALRLALDRSGRLLPL